jgi:hypothetical protein
MRFAQAQPPPALNVLVRTTQELSQECGELFNRTLESLSRKEGPEQGIMLHADIKRL